MDPVLAALLASGGLLGGGSSGKMTLSGGGRESRQPEKVNIILEQKEEDDAWEIQNHGPLSPTEAFRILRRPTRRSCGRSQKNMGKFNGGSNPMDSKAQTTQVSLILLLGLWNTHISCGPSQQGTRLIQLLKFARSQSPEGQQKEVAEDYNFSLSTVVLNDQDEEFLDFTIDGPYHCPPALPALAMYIPPSAKQGQEANRNQVKIHLSSRLKYIPMDAHVLRLLLTDFSEDGRVGGHTEKDSLSLFDSLSVVIDKLNHLTLQDYIAREEENTLMLAVSMGGSAALDVARKQQIMKRFKARNNATKSEAKKVPDPPPHDTCLRIFVAGDRSQVGKSSVCLGLLGSLLHLGYAPHQIAYIKPATQCEATQLVTLFCEHHDIKCVPVGPIVYYKGFTRAFLDGKTATTEELLDMVSSAVDELARDRQIIIIDGVGYPSVGSICGTSNASVARACGFPAHKEKVAEQVMQEVEPRTVVKRYGAAPVLLVGKSGVGDAIDSYNLNAAYFEASKVPVLGAVFNRLALEGYYSLENCRGAVERYFERSLPEQSAFGFIPEVEYMQKPKSNGDETDEPADDFGMRNVTLLVQANEFVIEFMKHVDVIGIINAAKRAQTDIMNSDEVMEVTEDAKQSKVSRKPPSREQQGANKVPRTRDEIEKMARAEGAKSS